MSFDDKILRKKYDTVTGLLATKTDRHSYFKVLVEFAQNFSSTIAELILTACIGDEGITKSWGATTILLQTSSLLPTEAKFQA
jgi:hypothetical protein